MSARRGLKMLGIGGQTMTNETIFYVIGLILGFSLGYAVRALKNNGIVVIVNTKKGDDDET